MVGTTHETAFGGLLDLEVSGMINTALAIRDHGALTTWKASLKEVIVGRITIVRRYPRVEDLAHKRIVVRLLVSRGGQSRAEEKGARRCKWRVEKQKRGGGSFAPKQAAAEPGARAHFEKAGG
jgi:hypothetical protein